MRTYCVAQGTLFNALCWPNWEGNPKRDLEKAVEPDIKLPKSVGSEKKQGNSCKTSTSASLTMLKSSTV